jgi:hypothetical protein
MNNFSKFLSDTILTCIKHKIGFDLVPEDHVLADGIKCSGYFDEVYLKVAIKKKDWQIILIHESCHLDQFTKKSLFWKEGEDGITLIDDWLKGKDFSSKKVEKSFKDTIILELDCEKRSLQKIKKYKLNIDSKEYIQKANAYLLSYWATYRDKKWYPFPYNKPEIYKQLPDKFLSLKEYYNKDSKYLKLYNENNSKT